MYLRPLRFYISPLLFGNQVKIKELVHKMNEFGTFSYIDGEKCNVKQGKM